MSVNSCEVQYDGDEPLPVMLVLCGLPSLVRNIHAARSNAERLFRAEELGNLDLQAEVDGDLSPAAEALVRPATDISYAGGVVEQVASDVDDR